MEEKENELVEELENFYDFENIIQMLHEFDYEKNGKMLTINFLAFCIQTISSSLLDEIEEKK